MNPTTSQPSAVRYLVVVVASLSAVLLYLDRFCISFAERFIKDDLRLTDDQMSWMLSAFFWAYGLGQVPSGWLADRFGARMMLSAYVLLWSAFAGMTGLAGGFFGLIAMRLACGLAQAGAYPTCAGLLSKWTPFSHRGVASSIVAFGGRIGGALAPPLTAALIVVFVPVTVSSRLTSDDLLDVYKLCFQISGTDDTPAESLGARLLGLAGDDFRRTVSHYAEVYESELDRIRQQTALQPEGHPPPEPKLDPPSSEDASLIVAELNRALAGRDLYDEGSFADVPLDREAKRLLSMPRAALSKAQIERLNRLLMEAVYPTGIRKVYVAGWRQTMWVFGAIGIVVAALFWLSTRNRPAEHPWCNAAEIAFIETGRPLGSPAPHGVVRQVPWAALLRSTSLWLNCVMQVGTNVGWVFLVTWLPRYLQEVHAVPVEMRGWMASVPIFVGWFGMLGGGWLTDRLVPAWGLRWGRSVPVAVTRLVAMGAYLLCLLPLSPWSVTAAFSLVALATDLGIGAVWAFQQDVGGRHVGSVLGWGNMWGNIGAALSPLLLNWLVKHAGWDAAFLACAAGFLVSGISALGIDATKPIDDQAAERQERTL